MITNARQKPISWDDKKIGPLISGQDVRHQLRNFEFPSPAPAHLVIYFDCSNILDRTAHFRCKMSAEVGEKIVRFAESKLVIVSVHEALKCIEMITFPHI